MERARRSRGPRAHRHERRQLAIDGRGPPAPPAAGRPASAPGWAGGPARPSPAGAAMGLRRFAGRGRAAVRNFAAFSRRLCPGCRRRVPRERPSRRGDGGRRTTLPSAGPSPACGRASRLARKRAWGPRAPQPLPARRWGRAAGPHAVSQYPGEDAGAPARAADWRSLLAPFLPHVQTARPVTWGQLARAAGRRVGGAGGASGSRREMLHAASCSILDSEPGGGRVA